MTRLLLDISGKVSKEHLKAISAIKNIAEGFGINFFVIGATARDFVLNCLYGIRSPRMTLDIDFGVEVEDWESYAKIEAGLIKTGQFTKGKEKHRFMYETTIIDIIPFGDISDNNNYIYWPPDFSSVMGVSGFEEAYQHATPIILSKDPYLEILVPTLPGLAVLKLLSWENAYPERPKDAEDFFFIINNYEHADIIDRLFDEKIEIFESENFDQKMTGIRLLGQDMAKICNPATLSEIKDILIKETSKTSQFHLITHMMDTTKRFDDILAMLLKLKKGFFEV